MSSRAKWVVLAGLLPIAVFLSIMLAISLSANPGSAPASHGMYAIREDANYEALRVMVTGVERSPGQASSAPRDGYEYAVVSVRMRNARDSAVAITPLDYKIKTKDGKLIEAMAPAAFSGELLRSGQLAAGKSAEGTLVFEVPQGDGIVLQYYDGIFEKRPALQFDLNNEK